MTARGATWTERPSGSTRWSSARVRPGLSAGYHLSKRGLSFVILDADARIGDHWRDRWDSLKLYSPARYDSLPGMRFPAPSWHYPTGREMGDYLEAYARQFELPVRSGQRVERVDPVSRRRVRRRARRRPRIAARQVISATGAFRDAARAGLRERARPVDPPAPLARLPATRPSSRTGPSSSSGCPTPAPTSRSRPPAPATGRSSPARSHGQMPIRVTDTKRALLGWPIIEFVFSTSPRSERRSAGRCGRRSARVAARSCGPAAGPRRGRASSATTRRPLACATASRCSPTARSLDVANVVWATGYRPDYTWSSAPIIGEDGWPVEEPRRQPDGPGPVLPGRPVPVRVLVDARRRGRPRREVRRRPDRGARRAPTSSTGAAHGACRAAA